MSFAENWDRLFPNDDDEENEEDEDMEGFQEFQEEANARLTEWKYHLKCRVKTLHKLLQMNAPKFIVQKQALSVQVAIAQYLSLSDWIKDE